MKCVRLVWWTVRFGKTDIAFCFSSEKEIYYNRRNTEEQKRMIRENFEDGGWRTRELLDEMSRCEDFYFDKSPRFGCAPGRRDESPWSAMPAIAGHQQAGRVAQWQFLALQPCPMHLANTREISKQPSRRTTKVSGPSRKRFRQRQSSPAWRCFCPEPKKRYRKETCGSAFAECVSSVTRNAVLVTWPSSRQIGH